MADEWLDELREWMKRRPSWHHGCGEDCCDDVPRLLELVDELQKMVDIAWQAGNERAKQVGGLRLRIQELEQRCSDMSNAEHMPTLGDLL